MARISTTEYIAVFKTFRDKNLKDGSWLNPEFKLGAQFLATVNAKCGDDNFGDGEMGYAKLKSKHAGVRAKITKGLETTICAKYNVTGKVKPAKGRAQHDTANLTPDQRQAFLDAIKGAKLKVNTAIPTLPTFKRGEGRAKSISAQQLLDLLT